MSFQWQLPSCPTYRRIHCLVSIWHFFLFLSFLWLYKPATSFIFPVFFSSIYPQYFFHCKSLFINLVRSHSGAWVCLRRKGGGGYRAVDSKYRGFRWGRRRRRSRSGSLRPVPGDINAFVMQMRLLAPFEWHFISLWHSRNPILLLLFLSQFSRTPEETPSRNENDRITPGRTEVGGHSMSPRLITLLIVFRNVYEWVDAARFTESLRRNFSGSRCNDERDQEERQKKSSHSWLL